MSFQCDKNHENLPVLVNDALIEEEKKKEEATKNVELSSRNCKINVMNKKKNNQFEFILDIFVSKSFLRCR